jgi:3-oxoacyl-[acyl-carrier-protein] synthase-3
VYSSIKGTGSALPKKIVTNADLEKIVDTTDEWIVDRTGIRQRHVAEEETTNTLATEAAQKAMAAAGVEADDIDLIIVATATPDRFFPSTACHLQHTLGTRECIAFDVQAACSGFIYALSVADNFIKAGSVKNALVIGAECLSWLVNWDDRSTCVIFGDGAGAVVLSASEEAGILSTSLHANGNFADLLYVDNPCRSQANQGQLDPVHLHMAGNKVFKLAVSKLGELVQDVVEKHQLSPDEIDWLIPHQANDRIIKATADRLKMPMSKVVRTVDIHGNTSAASVPLALDVAVRDGRVQKGHLCLLEAFGAGLTWGSVLVKM